MVEYGLVQTVAPATEPITVDEVKRQAAITGTADDTLLGELIARVRAIAERVTEQQLVTATWKLTLDDWPDDEDGVIRLPKGPLQSVTSVSYTDADGDLVEIDDAEYTVAIGVLYGRITPVGAWPKSDGPIEIVYVSGYGNAAAVPADIKGAMRQVVAYCYQQRENADPDVLEGMFQRHWGGVY